MSGGENRRLLTRDDRRATQRRSGRDSAPAYLMADGGYKAMQKPAAEGGQDFAHNVISLTRQLKAGEIAMFTNKKDDSYVVKGLDKWPTHEHLEAVRANTSRFPFAENEWERPERAIRKTCMERRVVPERTAAQKKPTALELKVINLIAKNPPFAEKKTLGMGPMDPGKGAVAREVQEAEEKLKQEQEEAAREKEEEKAQIEARLGKSSPGKPSAGSASPKRGSESPKRGSASPKRGSASPKPGSASPKRGSASPKRGSASPKRAAK